MSTDNPYSDLAPSAYWKTAVTDSDPAELTGLYKKKFELLTSDTVAAAGSCFAQRISQHLKMHGYHVADYEPRPDHITAAQASDYGYDLYSARYGNIYTVHQLLQLAKEAAGLTKPADAIWQREGRYYDAMRPSVQPDGFETTEALLNSREIHIASVLRLFQEMNVFIFTLGLTESWRHRSSGTVYPVAPGVIAGEFDESLHEFVNFSLCDTRSAFEEFVQVVTQLRKKSAPDFKIILTVSPVPLTATATGDHVLRATTYSKAVLRTMAEELRQEYEYIDYFPSFEIITNQMAKGSYYQSNGRSIHDSGVNAVMNVFFSEHANTNAKTNPATEQVDGDEHCDEVLLDAFAPGRTAQQLDTPTILFFGNSHMASVKNCLTDDKYNSPLSEQARYLAHNWLTTSWFHLRAHNYFRTPALKPEFAELYSVPPASTTETGITLVLSGLTVMGDGILRAFGDLKSGNAAITDGREISPSLPLLEDDSSIHVKKRFERYYKQYFQTVNSIQYEGGYGDIYIIESPDMIESVARFRLGDEFVESGSYLHYKRIARAVVNEYAQKLNIRVIGHPEHLLGQYGFSHDQYANTDKLYDIHVSGEYFRPALTLLNDYLEQGLESGRLPPNHATTDSTLYSAAKPALQKLGGIATNLASSIGDKINRSS